MFPFQSQTSECMCVQHSAVSFPLYTVSVSKHLSLTVCQSKLTVHTAILVPASVCIPVNGTAMLYFTWLSVGYLCVSMTCLYSVNGIYSNVTCSSYGLNWTGVKYTRGAWHLFLTTMSLKSTKPPSAGLWTPPLKRDVFLKHRSRISYHTKTLTNHERVLDISDPRPVERDNFFPL